MPLRIEWRRLQAMGCGFYYDYGNKIVWQAKSALSVVWRDAQYITHAETLKEAMAEIKRIFNI